MTKQNKAVETEYLIKVSSAKMPSSCWGRYDYCAVLEVEKGTKPSMISTRAKGVVRIVWQSAPGRIGSTERAASTKNYRQAQRIMAECQANPDAYR